MTDFDIQRIENAVWTLFQYQDEIENMSSISKFDRCEIKATFTTLSFIHELLGEPVEEDNSVEYCEHNWEHYTQLDDAFHMTRTTVFRCSKCGEKLTKNGVLR